MGARETHTDKDRKIQTKGKRRTIKEGYGGRDKKRERKT
jgi:hypothetical protein